MKEKISKLMGKLGRKGKSAEDIRKAQKTYYSSIMKYFHAEQMLKVEAMEGEHRNAYEASIDK